MNNSVSINDIKLEVKISTPSESTDKNAAYYILHDHCYNELFVCKSGKIEIKTANETIVLNRNDIAIFPPALEHTLKKNESPEINYSVIGFSFSKRSTANGFELYRVFKNTFYSSEPLIIRNAARLASRAVSVSENIRKTTNSFSHILEFSSLLTEIAENQKLRETEKNSNNSPSVELGRISALEQIIASKYTEDLTSKSIAAELFISERHLSRIVAKRYNKTLKEVIVSKRIKAAEEMLVNSDISATNLGARLGFSDNKIFYREFKKKHGITPTEYRKLKSAE